MRANRAAFLIAALMFAASVGAIALRPSARMADARDAVSLEDIVPRQFGEWREDRAGPVQVVNPQTQELLDRLYSQVLSRVYVNAAGYRVMLSLAYGSDQRGALQAHKPEVCYPAQGFSVHGNEPAVLRTAFGEIPARRLATRSGQRHEPLTYWFTVGDRAVEGKLQKRLADLSAGLTGRIPDGLIFRVSSIDSDAARAWAVQERFVGDVLAAVQPPERLRLAGLGPGGAAR